MVYGTGERHGYRYQGPGAADHLMATVLRLPARQGQRPRMHSDNKACYVGVTLRTVKDQGVCGSYDHVFSSVLGSPLAGLYLAARSVSRSALWAYICWRCSDQVGGVALFVSERRIHFRRLRCVVRALHVWPQGR